MADDSAAKRYVLITGCGPSSIGAALTRCYLDRGLHVIATVLPNEDRRHLATPNCHVYDCDVTQDASVQALEQQVTQLTGGKLDVLMNNAGLLYTMPAADSDIAFIERMYAVNVIGPCRMVKTFHRHLIRCKGLIVNTGSVGGISPYTYRSAYNGTKAALHQLGNTWRIEFSPFGVRVMNVISGEIGTNLTRGDAHRVIPDDSVYAPVAEPFQKRVSGFLKATPPSEYAQAVVDQALRPSPKAWFWKGELTGITWFFYMFMPQRAWDWLLWQMDPLKKLVGTADNV